MDKIEMSQGEFLILKKQARDGASFARFLKSEIRRIGKLIGEPQTASFATETDDVTKLQRVLKEYQRRWDDFMPPTTMSKTATDSASLPESPEAKKIYDALGVTPEDVQKQREKEGRA